MKTSVYKYTYHLEKIGFGSNTIMVRSMNFNNKRGFGESNNDMVERQLDEYESIREMSFIGINILDNLLKKAIKKGDTHV